MSRQLMRTIALRNPFGGRTAKTRDTAAGNKRRKRMMFIDNLVGNPVY
jgi:hypothetical protein